MNVNTVRLLPPFVVYHVALSYRDRETLEPFVQCVGIGQHGTAVEPESAAINSAREAVEASGAFDPARYEFVNASVAATVFEVP